MINVFKNIEKILCGLFLVLFIAILIIAKIGFIRKVDEVIYPQIPEFVIPEEDILQFKSYDKLITVARNPQDLAEDAILLKTNLFYEFLELPPEGPPFIVKEIRPVALDFIYQGVIELADRSLVAQINLKGETFFLKEGGRFGDYQLKKVTQDICTIVGPDAKERELPFKKQIFTGEYTATLLDPETEKSLKVKKGDKIGNYEILDIKANCVVLLDRNGERIILELEKGE